MISVTQLCRNRLEDVINLSNTILLPTVVQVYEFHGKSEKLKKKITKRLYKKIYREIIITQTALAHPETSQISRMDPFANMDEY